MYREGLYSKTIRRAIDESSNPEEYLNELKWIVDQLLSECDDCKIDNIDFLDYLRDEYYKTLRGK